MICNLSQSKIENVTDLGIVVSSMSGEVVDWNFGAFSLAKPAENIEKQVEVEGVGMVEVVIGLFCLLVLFLI